MAERPTVTLMCGAVVSSWSPEWLAETRDREAEVIAMFKMADREARRAYLPIYEDRQIALAFQAGHANPTAVGAEARRRLEAEVMARWHRQQAALSTTT